MGTGIFLGNAPWSRPGFYGVRAGSRWPHFEAEGNRYMPFPFQLAYSAALLEREDHQVMLVDGIAERMTEDAFLARAAGQGAGLVLLEVSTPSFPEDLRMVRRLRGMVAPGTRIVLAGPHAPLSTPAFLDTHPEVDFALAGEYELSLSGLARALAAGGDPAAIPGLVFRDGRGTARFTGPPRLVEDLDELPLPARHLLPMHRYFDNPGDIPEPAVQLWGSRGCPFSCSYCIWPQLMGGNRYRPRSAGAILDEMEHVIDRHGARSIYFDDDTFNIGRERMLVFCREKRERGLDIPWAIMARADLMDEEVLAAMAGAGLAAVKYGIESADPGLLARVDKRLDLDKAIRNIGITRRLGIRMHLTFMFGIPGETRETIRRTVRLARRLDPDSVQFSLLTPLPGTRIHEELTARGHLLERDWGKYDGYNTAVLRTDALEAEELEAELSRAWRSWFAHRALRGMGWRDIPRLLRESPRLLRNPRGTLERLRALFRA